MCEQELTSTTSNVRMESVMSFLNQEKIVNTEKSLWYQSLGDYVDAQNCWSELKLCLISPFFWTAPWSEGFSFQGSDQISTEVCNYFWIVLIRVGGSESLLLVKSITYQLPFVVFFFKLFIFLKIVLFTWNATWSSCVRFWCQWFPMTLIHTSRIRCRAGPMMISKVREQTEYFSRNSVRVLMNQQSSQNIFMKVMWIGSLKHV